MTGGRVPATCLCALVLTQLTVRAEPGATVEAGLPVEVKAFMKRRTDCYHWMGEEAYDAARGRAIATAVKALRCDAVEADEMRLRRRYGRDPAVLRSLDRGPDADG